MELKHHLQIGNRKLMQNKVIEEHTAAHIGSGKLKVLSTPWMIAYMEIAARSLLDECLPASHTSLGIKVNVNHLAPAAMGKEISATAEITSFEKNVVLLKIQALQDSVIIGEGIHHRYVVEIERYLKRVNAQLRADS
jgi:fluoroacetyl-CoA thioesterase